MTHETRRSLPPRVVTANLPTRTAHELLTAKLATTIVGEIQAGKDQAHDAPFTTLTDDDWGEMLEQVDLCCSDFVELVEQREGRKVVMMGLGMIEVASKMLLEGYALLIDGDLDLKPVPRG